MSTKFYGYKVQKDNFWTFVRQVRAFYAEHGFAHDMARAHKKYSAIETITDPVEAMDVVSEIKRGLDKFEATHKELTQVDGYLEVELQLFDFGDHYIFRVIESGYRFMNNYEEQGWAIEEKILNDQGDFPEEWTKEEIAARYEIVDQVEKLIEDREYFIVPIDSVEDLYNRLMDKIFTHMQKQAEAKIAEKASSASSSPVVEA